MSTKSYPVTGPIDLHVRIGHGSLTVHAQDALTEATVSAVARQPDSDIVERTAIEMRDKALVVVTPRRGGIFDLFGGPLSERDSVDITVTVPSGSTMKLSSHTAAVHVDGRSGSADVTAGAASIDVAEVDGDLRLRFGSGNAQVDRVSGSVQARAGSGSASLGNVGGSLNCVCGSGRLEAAAVHGSVRARSGSGTSTLGAVYGDVDLASGSGGVEIGVPQGTSAKLDVTTGSGRVLSDLPIEQAPANGGSRISIRARTGSGNIRLHPAVPAAS